MVAFSAALLGPSGAVVVNEDLAHRARRDGEKVGVVEIPDVPRSLGELDVGLVDDSGSIEGLLRAPAQPLQVSEASKLGVGEPGQFVERGSIVLAGPVE
jgi:hypothetical protein